MKTVENIADVPQHSRQLIMIFSDDDKEKSVDLTPYPWGRIATAVGAITLSAVGGPVGLGAAILASGIRLEYERRKKKIQRAILPIAASTAKESLWFPIGHPLPHCVYGCHPLRSHNYYPLGEYHNYLFEDKCNELLRLLASLGARLIDISYVQGYRSGAGINLASEQIVSENVDLSINAERKHVQASKGLFHEEFDQQRIPEVPSGLIWFPHEKIWQSLVERRLSYGTTKFKINLSYQDDYNVNASLGLALNKIGAKFGASSLEFHKTVWKIEGEFYSLNGKDSIAQVHNEL